MMNIQKQKELKVFGVAILFTFAISLSTVSAQEGVIATGGNASGSVGSASYSVGQVVYTTNTGANGSVVQGVQQPYEISIVTELEEAKSINLTVTAYPNPASEYLILEVKDFEISNLLFQLYDMNGRLLKNEKITSNQTKIVMNNLVSAHYFVKVIQNNTLIKEFKIIKN